MKSTKKNACRPKEGSRQQVKKYIKQEGMKSERDHSLLWRTAFNVMLY